MSILREVFLRLGLDVDEAAFAKGQIAASLLTASVSKVVEKAKELGEAFVENIKATAEFGEQISELNIKTGVSTDALQSLGAAAQVHGIGLDTMGRTLGALARQMENVRTGSGEAAEAFAQIGVRATDSAGKLRPIEDVLGDIADKFQSMGAGPERLAAVQKLFRGRMGQALLPMLAEGREGLEKFALPPISQEQIEAGRELVETQRALTLQTENLWRTAVGPLLPDLKKLLDDFYEWKKANAEIIRQNLTSVIKAGIAVVRGLGEAFKVLVAGVKLFKDEWKIVATMLLATLAALAYANANQVMWWLVVQNAAVGAALKTAAAWALAAAPFVIIGSVIAGLAALAQDIKMDDELGDKADTLTGRLRRFIAEIGAPKANEPWWLTAIREANKAMQSLIELHRTFKKESVGEWITGGDVSGPGTPNARTRKYEEEHGASWWKSRGDFSDSGLSHTWIQGDAPTAAPAPSVSPSSVGWARGGDTSVEINIHGATDPVAVGKEVGRLLDARGVLGQAHVEAAMAHAP